MGIVPTQRKVEVEGPLKQGLKLGPGDGEPVLIFVEVEGPLKQGLKQIQG